MPCIDWTVFKAISTSLIKQKEAGMGAVGTQAEDHIALLPFLRYGPRRPVNWELPLTEGNLGLSDGTN